MIEYRTMDITTATRGIVAHGVNCQKKMGSGVAKAIREKWPMVYTLYMSHTPFLGMTRTIPVGPDLWVANCYTQWNYGYDGGRYADPIAIDVILSYLAALSASKDWVVYLPKIGCGLGGLDWKKDVATLLWKAHDSHPGSNFVVCEFGGEQLAR